MKPVRSVAFFVAMAIVPASAWSTTTVNASKDNTIYQSNSSFSGGGAAGIHSGANSQGSIRRGLLAFDIAPNVPAGSIITAAQLTMYLGAAPNSNNVTIELHKLTKDWGEGTAGSSTLSVSGSGMGFAASNGDATWSHAKFGSVTWANLGATGDFYAVASGATDVTGPVETPFTWNSTPELIADVQSWLDSPASNFGWALVNANEAASSSVKAFYSRSATQNSSGGANSLDLSWRPSLAITYVETGDYNRNGFVDAADYVAWRKTRDQTVYPFGSGADGDQSGTIDDGDYAFWRARFGNGPNAFASGAAIPEPGTVGLILVAGPLVFFRKRR